MDADPSYRPTKKNPVLFVNGATTNAMSLFKAGMTIFDGLSKGEWKTQYEQRFKENALLQQAKNKGEKID